MIDDKRLVWQFNRGSKEALQRLYEKYGDKMKPVEKPENFVRRGKAKVTTDPRMDRHVLDDAFAVMDKSSTLKQSRSTWTWHRSSTIRLAVAAMIIVAISLLAIQLYPPKEVPSEIRPAAKSAADRLSAMSLNMAYRRGGIEAVDALADAAFNLPRSNPASLSVRELLTESNGV